MQYDGLFAEQAKGTERARARSRSLLKKLRRGLWRFNCSPRLWLESSKIPFASDAGSVTLLNAPRFLVTYREDDDEEEKRSQRSQRLMHFGPTNYCFVSGIAAPSSENKVDNRPIKIRDILQQFR